MSKHTPGPWFAVEYGGFWEIQEDHFYSVEDNLLDQEKCENAEANARLCAAAPEMYSMLKGVVDGNTLDPAIVEELLNKINH